MAKKRFSSGFSTPFSSALMRQRYHSLLSFSLYCLLYRVEEETLCWVLLSHTEIKWSDSAHTVAFQVLLRPLRSISSLQLFQFFICSQLSPSNKPRPAPSPSEVFFLTTSQESPHLILHTEELRKKTCPNSVSCRVVVFFFLSIHALSPKWRFIHKGFIASELHRIP